MDEKKKKRKFRVLGKAPEVEKDYYSFVMRALTTGQPALLSLHISSSTSVVVYDDGTVHNMMFSDVLLQSMPL